MILDLSELWLTSRIDNQADHVAAKQALILDLLSVHLIRNVSGNTMISFNTNKIFGCRDPVPNYLYQRILYAG